MAMASCSLTLAQTLLRGGGGSEEKRRSIDAHVAFPSPRRDTLIVFSIQIDRGGFVNAATSISRGGFFSPSSLNLAVASTEGGTDGVVAAGTGM